MVTKAELRAQAAALESELRIQQNAVYSGGYYDAKTGARSGYAYVGPRADEIFAASLPTQPSAKFLNLTAQYAAQKYKYDGSLGGFNYQYRGINIPTPGAAMNYNRMLRLNETSRVDWHHPAEGYNVLPRYKPISWESIIPYRDAFQANIKRVNPLAPTRRKQKNIVKKRYRQKK